MKKLVFSTFVILNLLAPMAWADNGRIGDHVEYCDRWSENGRLGLTGVVVSVRPVMMGSDHLYTVRMDHGGVRQLTSHEMLNLTLRGMNEPVRCE